MPPKKTAETASRAGGAIERFIERTLAPRLEEIAGEVRSLRGEMHQMDKRLSDGISSLRTELNTRIEGSVGQLNTRIDALSQRLDDALNVRERLVALEAKFSARNN